MPRRQEDERGSFVKVFHRDTFTALGLVTDFPEEYYSLSRRGVIRGLHFQVPPAQHVKLVFCTQGWVQDVVVDLRAGSPTYRRHAAVELSAEAANLLYIPPGLAHGFCVLSGWATLVYKVSSQYSPEHDAGILWNSAGIDWTVDAPIISARDQAHPRLGDFKTPFCHTPGGLQA
jgi:dTDP-4-dehydrorhamnose 3,5-epimerase